MVDKSFDPIAIACEIFPEGDNTFWNMMLWEFTGYPYFFTDEKPISEQIREQLQYAKDNPDWHPLDE